MGRRSGGLVSTLLGVVLVAAACGGGTGGLELPDPASDDVSEQTQDTSGSDQADSGGAADLGSVTQTAAPSMSWIEVEGTRYDMNAVGTVNYECVIAEDRVSINFQTNEESSMTIQGSNQTGEWFLSLTFAPGDDSNVQYGASLTETGEVGAGDNSLSFEGNVQKVVDFDVASATDTPGTVAVNCNDPDPLPSAEVGGQSYEFPFSGASGITCEITPELVDVLINRFGPDNTQLQISASRNGDNWLGSVSISTTEDTFSSTIPEDGSGLTIDGASVSYEGTFSSSGGDTDGSASATCP
jgi:hypothetical protein